ncbi:MAG: hypothetical protein ACD_39C01278G0003 [uncultured bacterium]|nr:MAG: hypothetical protein ACD_39C01278G0003 [uncultured bacterium]
MSIHPSLTGRTRLATTGLVMNSLLLVSPAFKKFKRVFSHRNRMVLTFLSVGSLLTAALIYYGLYRFLEYVGRAPMLGDTFGPVLGGLLVSKLLEMLFLTLFFMVLFSSIIAALSSFFLNEELPTLMSSPLPIGMIFRSRMLLMTIESSWMVIVFFMPALYAFATALKASWPAYLIFPLFLLCSVLLPNLAGGFTALSLAAFFPIRQMKKVFQFLSILVLTALIFFLRSLEAEKLLNPNYFKDISQYILSLELPLISYSPSSWLHQASISLFRNNTGEALKQIAPLVALTITGLLLLNLFARKFYRQSWQRSMEAVDNQVLGLEWLRRVLVWPFRWTDPVFRVIANKEITTFVRDPAIFSQIFMMTAIVFVYGYNLSILPLKDIPSLYSGELNDTLVFLNGPFIGFIVASIGMRFVFPSISMEGRAFWAVKSSPVSPRKILFTKLFLYLVPMMILGIILCMVTNSVFKVSHPILMYMSYINVMLITLVITSLAIGVGAVYADFSADSPLKIAGSYGGFIYMLLSGFYIINLLALEVYPMYRLFFNRFYLTRGSSGIVLIALSSILLMACTAIWVYLPFRKGLDTIENYEPE